MTNENMTKKNLLSSPNLNEPNKNGRKFSNHSSYFITLLVPFAFHFRYEQSKVYQYLKQSDFAYNVLVERKESLHQNQKLAYQDYHNRRKEFCDEGKFRLVIVSMAKYFLSRRDQLMKIEEMKKKFIEFENKQKQLMESKADKMKAWENVYTQPVKRDLMDFCLQTNIDQALTISFTQIQQDIWSQPMTPTTVTVLTPQNEQIELVPQKSDLHR